MRLILNTCLVWLLFVGVAHPYPSFAGPEDEHADVTEAVTPEELVEASAAIDEIASTGPVLSQEAFPTSAETIQLDAISRASLEDLVRRVKEWAAQKRAELGEKAFKEAVEKSTVFVDDANLGRAEYTPVEENYAVRVVLKSRTESFIFLEPGEVARNSPHLRQIISRQHHIAGKSHGLRGRDVVIAWWKDGRISNDVPFELLTKPQLLRKQWWKEYFWCFYKRPTSQDVIAGVVFGGAQFLLAYGIEHLRVQLGNADVVTVAPAVFSAIFGSVIATFMSTFRNWTHEGTIPVQNAKSWAVSLSFAVPVVAFTKGIGSLSPLELAGISQWAQIWLNTVLNGVARVEANQFVKSRSDARINAGTLEIPLGNGNKITTNVSRAAFENQVVYLGQYVFKMADLTGLSVMGIPVGKAMFFAFSPVMQAFTTHYAERNNFEDAKALRTRWEARKEFWIKGGLPLMLLEQLHILPSHIASFARSGLDAAMTTWQRFFPNQSVPEEPSDGVMVLSPNGGKRCRDFFSSHGRRG